MGRQSIQSARSAANPRRTAWWGESLSRWWRSLVTPSPWSGKLPAPTSTVSAQFWADASPARFTAGWVLLAALLAAGSLEKASALDWKQITLLWLLVDLLWGALWRMSAGRNHLLPLRTAASGEAAVRLPYLRRNSPADQLLGLDESNSLPYLVRVALPALAVALIVAGVLGVSAVICTVLVAAITVGGWILRRTLTAPPLLLRSLVLVALPWLLSLVQLGIRPGHDLWAVALALGAFWTLHAWGDARSATWPGDSMGLLLLALAHIGILAILVINKTPIWVPIVAALLLPTWLRAARRQSLEGLSLWWAAALIVSALALGWR